jgi:hypothetical protein
VETVGRARRPKHADGTCAGDPLPPRTWMWALVAGVLGITSTIAMAFATARLANLSRDAFALPINLANYPMLTVLCAIGCISATAGVVEEVF